MYEIHVQRGRKISVRAASQPSYIDIIVIALLETSVVESGVVCGVCVRACVRTGMRAFGVSERTRLGITVGVKGRGVIMQRRWSVR